MMTKRALVSQEKLIWHTSDQVFKKASKTKEYQESYAREKFRIRLAKEIKETRIAMKLTQSALAKKADMPQSAIARLESGKHSISLETLFKITFVLKKQIRID